MRIRSEQDTFHIGDTGFHIVDLANESRLEDRLCWNDAEVEMRLREGWSAGVERPEVTCGYCDEAGIQNSRRFRKSQISTAIDWFRYHPCGVSTDVTTLATAPERTLQSVAA